MSISSHPILILILSQAVFTATDLLGRYQMRHATNATEALFKPWLILFLLGHAIASVGQLYVFARFEVGKTVALFGAVSIMLATVLGLLLLQETLSLYAYFGVVAAILAFFILAFAK